MADDVLRLEGITKTYGAGTPAATEVLHGIDVRLARGEFVALIGPSGSGKITLLNIIGLLERPSGGVLRIDGRDSATLDDNALTRLRGRSIGFMIQYHYLISAFTALENVMMPELLARGSPDRAMREHALALLGQVGLAQWRDHMASNLSGGQQQRVAIARTLALEPPLVLADEPTGNLDTQSADSVFDLMRHVSADRRTTFLFVTHNTALAQRCDRLVELVDGRIVSNG
ncbi:ABC transporter ATP-binding protein [Massilia sp. TWR1-2-2]|uniref:ABC transporter ATP-binding protein n=1 Tax=Massilia sp. TWR1-2-2 TaxID=2804584 RepID=UPI003CEA3046